MRLLEELGGADCVAILLVGPSAVLFHGLEDGDVVRQWPAAHQKLQTVRATLAETGSHLRGDGKQECYKVRRQLHLQIALSQTYH